MRAPTPPVLTLGVATTSNDVSPHMRRVADGHTNATIGERLFMSVDTVEKHLTVVYTKVKVNSCTDPEPPQRLPGAQTKCAVFTQSNGQGYRPKRLSSQFTTASDAAGLPRNGAHGLRHSYATAALRAGVPPEVVSKRLGHASVVVTLSIYAHVFEQDDQAAAELTARAIFGA